MPSKAEQTAAEVGQCLGSCLVLLFIVGVIVLLFAGAIWLVLHA